MPTPKKLLSGRRIVWFFVASSFGIAIALYIDANPYSHADIRLFVPFIVGSGLFCIYAPFLGERIHDSETTAFNLYGFGGSFAIWGSVIGCCYGGFFGAVQAAICTIFLSLSLKNALILPAPLLFLIPAWCIASVIDKPIRSHVHSNTFTLMSTIAVTIWNMLLFAWMTFIAVTVAKRRKWEDTYPCLSCGYSLIGLTTDRCPECGHEFSQPASTA